MSPSAGPGAALSALAVGGGSEAGHVGGCSGSSFRRPGFQRISIEQAARKPGSGGCLDAPMSCSGLFETNPMLGPNVRPSLSDGDVFDPCGENLDELHGFYQDAPRG